MNQNDAILITGAGGLAGMALCDHFKAAGFTNIIALTSKDCDLTDRLATRACFERHKPAYVFHMAGHVFGIMGNMKNQAAAYLNNTLINTHVVEASHRLGVKKLIAMGTVAMYPDPLPSNPAREADIWAGPPHHSEYGYAQAKRAMLAQVEACHTTDGMAYAFALSTNLYGPHDRFNIETGHVLPSLIRKFYEAATSGGTVTVWGDGSGQRDFLYIKDAARALHHMADNLQGTINLATGTTHKIREVVDILAKHTGLQDRIIWDSSKPNGQIIRAYDVTKLRESGFRCGHSLAQGLIETYEWYAAHAATARK